MAGRAATPQGRKLGNINNMPNRGYLPSINFSVPFARWSHFYVSLDWTSSRNDKIILSFEIYHPKNNVHNQGGKAKVKTKHDRAQLMMRALHFTADRDVSYRNSTPRSSTFVVKPLIEH
jgi:hypothetical protein